jgi:hypothetical protein
VITCTRPSTVSSALEDKSGLFGFIASTTLMTVMGDRALRNQAALIASDNWRDYQDIYKAADRKRGKPEADHGTLIHRAVQAMHAGDDVSAMDADIVADARAVTDALRTLGLEMVESEANVVTLDLPEPMAGTRDILARQPDGRFVVVDIKSTSSLGGARFRALSWSVQIAIYANGDLYPAGDYHRDRWGRPVIDEELIIPETRDIELSEALVVEVERGTGRYETHVIDIAAGWELAELACRVRAARKASLLLGSGKPVVPSGSKSP